MNSPSTRPGYTLIELLISISIMTLLVVSGTSAYYRSQQRHATRAETDELISILENTQKQANIGTRSNSCTGEFLGYQVVITTDSSSINITPRCQIASDPTTTTTFSYLTFSSDYSLTFLPLAYGINLGPNTSSLNLEYSDNLSNTHQILLNKSGSIEYLGTI